MLDLREVIERTRSAATDAAARLRPPYPPVAIEVDRREALIVRLRRPARGRAVLEAHAVRPLTVEAVPGTIFEAPVGAVSELTQRFRDLFEASGTRPGRVSLVLPDNVAKISLIALPERPAGSRQLDELVRARMRRSVPFRLDEAVLSYQLFAGEGRQVAVLVLLARRFVIERLEQALAPLGVRAGLIDISTPNLLNLCRQRLDAATADGEDAALLNSTPDYFSLVIVRGGRPIFFRCKSLGEEPPGANGNGVLAREMAGSLSYYRDKLAGRGLATILVRAAGGPFEDLAAKLHQLDLERVEPVAVAESIDGRGSALAPELALRIAPAIGAALGRGR